MRKIIDNRLSDRHRLQAFDQIRCLERKLPGSVSRFAIAFVFRGRGYFKSLQPRQNPVEIQTLFDAVCELRLRRALEIGTANGGLAL